MRTALASLLALVLSAPLTAQNPAPWFIAQPDWRPVYDVPSPIPSDIPPGAWDPPGPWFCASTPRHGFPWGRFDPAVGDVGAISWLVCRHNCWMPFHGRVVSQTFASVTPFRAPGGIVIGAVLMRSASGGLHTYAVMVRGD